MSILVVAWHIHLFGVSLIFSEAEYLIHEFCLSDFINFHILLLAVPVFIFMSLFLFSRKAQSLSTLFSKLKKLLILCVFWVLAIKIWESGSGGLRSLTPTSINSFLSLILTGGGTIYYFFVSLILCLFFTYFILKLSVQKQIIGLLISLICLFVFPQISIAKGFYELSAYWNPLNFLPYCFGAVLLANNIELIVKYFKILSISLILFIIFSYLEWSYCVNSIFFPGQGYAIPAYTRVSLFFGALSFMIIALRFKKSTPPIINFMSRYSLPLFILHPFIIPLSKKIAYPFFYVNSFLFSISSFIITISLSYILAFFLKKMILKKSLI
jgi:hypothetical protein